MQLMGRRADQISWPRAPRDWSRRFCEDRDRIDIWAASTDATDKMVRILAKDLGASELQRASAFRHSLERNRFIARRHLLRSIIGCYLNVDATAVEFNNTARGKPTLGGDFADAGLHFNVAHSDGLAVVAISNVGAIGVDVEKIRRFDEIEQLVESCFSHRERTAFGLVPPNEKSAAFFRLWTRKEALLKANGDGIGRSLDIEVPFDSHEAAERDDRPKLRCHRGTWYFYDLSPAPGFAVVLVAPVVMSRLGCWRWTPQ